MFVNMMKQFKHILLLNLGYIPFACANEAQDTVDYWTIEGMRSQEFSVGIFIFMIIGVLVFLGIIAKVSMAKKASERLKTGEKVLLVWIILGVIAAITFGGMQLLQGRLF